MSKTLFTYRASELILKQLHEELNQEEVKELEQLKTDNPSYQWVVDELTDENVLAENIGEFDGLKDRIGAKLYAIVPEARPVTPIYKRSFFRIAVAACIAGLIIAGGYFIFFAPQSPKGDVSVVKVEDVKAPTSDKAVITLADGRKVSLDSLTMLSESNASIVRTADGKVIYSTSPNPSKGGELVYNTLTNPRGSKIVDMTLADGSHVWLNAGSSITYPVSFVGDERKVSMNGEAYFEIKHLTQPSPGGEGNARPFIVSKGDMQVQVLGTHFNVNAYDDEEQIKVTLLEGSVKTSIVNGESAMLKPGEQAEVPSGAKDDNPIKVIKGIDVDAVMAWKNGNFSFNNTDLKSIMRQVMRWYDVDVVYEGNVPVRYFNADVSRDKNLSAMLKILELNNVHFRLEGRKLIVTP